MVPFQHRVVGSVGSHPVHSRPDEEVRILLRFSVRIHRKYSRKIPELDRYFENFSPSFRYNRFNTVAKSSSGIENYCEIMGF